ncbi:MAG: LamG-like jellyroll fold domain-containing protein [Planctomycetota bacterium]
MSSDPAIDPRNIVHGREIPSEGYADQPYVVINDDGSWLCVMTTGEGREGASGQHVVAMRSADQGKTWSAPAAVEPADGPEASYAVLLKVPGGRVYCFYNHNSDNLREVIADDPPFKGGKCRRVDSLGYFVFKYSDDGGASWSDKRYAIPIRETAIDRENVYGGKVRFFWNVGRPFIHGGAAFVSVHKVGGFGEGFFTRSEGALLKSENILTERNPDKIAWQTLPDGDAGLRTPPGGGPIAEEQSYSVLSDGSFYCVYRTIDGHPACAYSRDGGRTWSEPHYKRYADGRMMRHPRAANFAWKCRNGRFLYWFHNHGGNWYDDRNPVWLCGGVEADDPEGRVIRWSQPEIVLYDDDPFVRMSYPDLIEDGGRYFLTETQKNIARVHEIAPALLDGLWNQFDNKSVATQGIVLDLAPVPEETPMPKLPDFVARDAKRMDYGTKDLRAGFSLDLWICLDSLDPNQIILDSRTENGQGLCLQTTSRGAVEIVLNDGRTENRWDCDPGMIESGRLHHIAVIVDGGPKIITFVIDGKLCDGGERRQFGWGRYSPNLRGVKGGETLCIGPSLSGEIKRLRIYNRALRVSEAIGNFQAGIR